MKWYWIALIVVIVILLIVGGGIGIYYATKEESIPQFVIDAQKRFEDEEKERLEDEAAAAAKIALEKEPAAKEAAKLAEIDAALAEVYGLSPATTCPTNPCMYGIIGMTGGHCRAIAGAMNGTPADNAWTSCYVNFGKNAPRAFFAANSCPAGECQYGHIQTTGATCRAIGGAMNGTPGDDDWTSCYLDVGPVTLAKGPKYGLFPPGKCPFGTCYPVRITAQGDRCRAVGGTTVASHMDWGACEMNLGQTARI